MDDPFFFKGTVLAEDSRVRFTQLILFITLSNTNNLSALAIAGHFSIRADESNAVPRRNRLSAIFKSNILAMLTAAPIMQCFYT
jgi:hypothetical protein